MSLVTEADFQQNWTARTTPGLIGKSGKLYDLVRIRINGALGTPKMPQGNELSPGDFNTFDSWLANGAPAGATCGGAPGGGGSTSVGGGGTPSGGGSTSVGGGGYPGSGGSVGGGGTPVGSGGSVGGGGTPVGGGGSVSSGGGGGEVSTGGTGATTTFHDIITADTTDNCANDPSQFQPLVAQPGETCYEFPVHGVSSPTDTSKFTVPTGQSYNQYYFNVPWPKGTVATRFGAKFDQLAVLHHWLGFSTTTNTAAGTVQANVTGTTLGDGANLIGGWAIGGCNVNLGPDIGLTLPDPGTGQIMIQWHNYNSTGAPVQDGSAVQFCTMPASARAHIGGLTFLGTENLDGLAGMPAGQTSQFSGACTNNSGKPIIIKGWDPHMHLLGTHMTSIVTHMDGTQETIFDHPFLFDHQVNYVLPNGYELEPGEKITSTCTFDNTTSAPVGFGTSTTQEMCYQFTYSYPLGALNNGVISLIGAQNTCW